MLLNALHICLKLFRSILSYEIHNFNFFLMKDDFGCCKIKMIMKTNNYHCEFGGNKMIGDYWIQTDVSLHLMQRQIILLKYQIC